MTHVESGVSLGADNTFNIYDPDPALCRTCELNKLNQPQVTPKRGYGITKTNGGKRQLSYREQLAATYGGGIKGEVNKPKTSCEVYSEDMAIMSTSEASAVEQVTTFAPCLGGTPDSDQCNPPSVGSGSFQDRLRAVYGNRHGNGEP